MSNSNLSCGTIVSLKSHPYAAGLSNVIIKGDANSVSPLMIVVAVHRPKEPLALAGKKGLNLLYSSPSCRCLWYCNRTNTFNYVWFPCDMLEVISEAESGTDVPANLLKKVVALKTLPFELKKRKSSLVIHPEEDMTNGKRNSTVTGLLSFTSPLLHVIDLHEEKAKDGSKASDRSGSTVSAKCKWYNSSSNRFSEVSIPIEALQIIPPLDPVKLSRLDEVIRDGKYLIATVAGSNHIVKPRYVSFLSGLYSICAFDYITNTNIEIPIADLSLNAEHIRLSFYDDVAPTFSYLEGDSGSAVISVLDEVEQLVRRALNVNSLLRIKYKSRNGNITVRTIGDVQLLSAPADAAGLDLPNDLYLKGFCFLRNAERTFKLGRIQRVQSLPIEFAADGEIVKLHAVES